MPFLSHIWILWFQAQNFEISILGSAKISQRRMNLGRVGMTCASILMDLPQRVESWIYSAVKRTAPVAISSYILLKWIDILPCVKWKSTQVSENSEIWHSSQVFIGNFLASSSTRWWVYLSSKDHWIFLWILFVRHAMFSHEHSWNFAGAAHEYSLTYWMFDCLFTTSLWILILQPMD